MSNNLIERLNAGEYICWTKENFDIEAFLLDFSIWQDIKAAHLFIFNNAAIIEHILNSPEFALKTPTPELLDFLKYLHMVAWSIRQYGTADLTAIGKKDEVNYVPNPLSYTFRHNFAEVSDEYQSPSNFRTPLNGFPRSLPVVVLNSLMSLPDKYGNYRGFPELLKNGYPTTLAEN